MDTSFARKPARKPGISHRGNQSNFFGAANPLPDLRSSGITDKERVDVLYLDERPELLETMGDFFRRNGMSAITATSVELAMRLPDEWSVGVIVIDASVAGENGGELVRFLHANHPATPIILRTSMALPLAQEFALVRRGVARCVSRSESPEVLLDMVLVLRPNQERP